MIGIGSAVRTFFGVLFVLLYAVAVTSNGALKGEDAFALRWTVLSLAAGVSGAAAWLRWRYLAGRQVATVLPGVPAQPRGANITPPARPTVRSQERTATAAVEAARRHAIVFRQHFPPRFERSHLSFFGAAPIVPEGFSWPRSAGRNTPLSFLLQVDCAAVSDPRRLLPDRGVVYFFQDLTWGEPNPFRVLYADGSHTGGWRVVEPPDDLEPAYGDQAAHVWKWPHSSEECPRLLPKWTFDPVVVNLPDVSRDEEDPDAPYWWPGEKATGELLRAVQGEDVAKWFTVGDFTTPDGALTRPFPAYPQDWRAVQIASGLVLARVSQTHGLRGTSHALRDRSEAEREALRIQIRDDAAAWFDRAASEPAFAAVPQSTRDGFWSWLEAYPWMMRFVIVDAVTLLIEASLAESPEAGARIPAVVARRIQNRHALAVKSEHGLFASTPNRMLAPPVDVQGHQYDRARTHLLLLELSSEDGLGHHFGEGVYQFWITPDDLKARRFDKVELTADAY